MSDSTNRATSIRPLAYVQRTDSAGRFVNPRKGVSAMAGTTVKATDSTDGGWEKVEVAEPPARLVWERTGDVFTGTYQGEEKAGIDPENGRAFSKYAFVDPDGVRVHVDQSASVKAGMTEGRVKPGDEVRLTYVSDTDTGQDNPRRDITVEVKRAQTRTAGAVVGRYTPRRSA